MHRRDFIKVIAASAVTWPTTVRAQSVERMRRVGVLMGYAQSDRDAQSFLSAFVQSLQQSGWTVGQNVLIKSRWAGADANLIQKFPKELVELQPDVILANTTPVTVTLHRETHTIPIVFVIVSDPVGAGLVTNLSQPGGNVTGFINVEASLGGKWLELLKEIAPRIQRAAIMFNPDTAPDHGSYFSSSFEAAARTLGIEPITAAVRSEPDIERSITALGRELDGALVVSADGFLIVHRASIISLAAQNNVPAVYFTPAFAKAGGLMAYGADSLDVFRRAGPYVARVLRGEKPSDLPVQVPTKFELVINLKTAKALGITVPQTLQVAADEVIE